MAGVATSRDADILRRLHQLGKQLQEEVEATSRQLAELQVLLRQTAGEVDRLAPRSSQAAQRLRDMEAHVESYSRADIKEIYATAQEAQMRLFMMQLQQEQLVQKQRILAPYHDVVAQVVSLGEQVEIEEDEKPGSREVRPLSISPQESIARIIKAQEDERRRVSRQIHDGPAQALANLVLRAEICERLMINDKEQARNELVNLKRLVTDSLQHTRNFIFDLRPMILDDLGLAPTLRRYCQMLGDGAGVPIRLSISGTERRLPPPVEIALFRVAQEAVQNALQHGEPQEIQVMLEGERQAVSVAVRDDGRGCDGDAVLTAARQGQTMGLAHMEEYIRSLGGRFTFESAPGQGCSVTALVPLSGQAV